MALQLTAIWHPMISVFSQRLICVCVCACVCIDIDNNKYTTDITRVITVVKIQKRKRQKPEYSSTMSGATTAEMVPLSTTSAVLSSRVVSASNCGVRGPRFESHPFIVTAAAVIYSLGHGLCTFTAVPRSTQPSTLRGMVKWVSAYGLSNNNNGNGGCGW